jgi:hypothetical protein
MTTTEEEIDLTYITRNNSTPTLISITKARREISRQLQSRVWRGPADSAANIEIYHWDGQTLCCNPDILRDKTSLTSKVPFFCSNFNSKRSSNSTNLLITMASLHSIAAMASFVKLNVRALSEV